MELSLAQAVLSDDEIDVFVAAAAEVDEDGLEGVGLGQFAGVGDGMGAFEGGDDAFAAAQFKKGVDRFIIGNVFVMDAFHVVEHGMLWADAGVVESAGDGVDGGG